jgi:hypothetical protein
MSELKIDRRIVATFSKVYCGVVGGLRRHEFACTGAAVSCRVVHTRRRFNLLSSFLQQVNLTARFMGSKVNQGILVDEAVSAQCRGGKFSFRSLPQYVQSQELLNVLLPHIANQKQSRASYCEGVLQSGTNSRTGNSRGCGHDEKETKRSYVCWPQDGETCHSLHSHGYD